MVFDSGGQTITSSLGHRYFTQRGWIGAEDLRAGDILQLVNGETVIVEQVQHELLESPETLYNFSVDGNHNYYVAESVETDVNDFVLAHNKCFRDRLKEDTGLYPTGKEAQAHHRLPQHFKEQFELAGITDIDDPQYMQWVVPSEHSHGSSAYDKLWQGFFDTHANPTVDDILSFMRQDNVWNFFSTWGG